MTAPRTKAFNRDTSKDPAKHWLMMSQVMMMITMMMMIMMS